MRYFEREADAKFSYVHLSLFQMIEGLRYAFPQAMKRRERNYPAAEENARPGRRHVRGWSSYLLSPRRIPFNQQGIFRHYPELDAK